MLVTLVLFPSENFLFLVPFFCGGFEAEEGGGSSQWHLVDCAGIRMDACVDVHEIAMLDIGYEVSHTMTEIIGIGVSLGECPVDGMGEFLVN